ncbi:MAG TPA: sialidase family protein, partial [Balneolales bacterium]|nr:sialidase family protein [Balneolales bacterium]
MKKLLICFVFEGILLLSMFTEAALSQKASMYTFITGPQSSATSSLLAPNALTVESTPSNYPNITLYPDGNVDQSEMSIVSMGGDVLSGDNSEIQTVSPVEGNQGYYYSGNSGENWTGSDSLYKTINPNINGLSDPEVAYDLNGHAFYSYLRLHYNSQGNVDSTSVMIKESTDDGTTWGSEKRIAGPTYALDKDYMTIDDNPSSPDTNNIYIAWTDFSGSGTYPIKFSRSTDDGTSFSTPDSISGSSGYYSAQGVCLAVGPDGTLYATWVYYDSWPDEEAAIGFNKSTDGGKTWGTPKRLSIQGFSGIRSWDTQNSQHWSLHTKGTNIRSNSFPSMDVDRTSGPNRGKIYIVWDNATNTTDHTIPYIYCISSADGGASWGSKVQVNDDNSQTDKWEPWVHVDSLGGVNVVFYDSRIDPANNVQTQVYLGRSMDGGTSFQNYQVSDVAFTPSQVPNTGAGYMGDYLGITSTGNYLIPCWNDNRTGRQQAYAARIPFVFSGTIASNTTLDGAYAVPANVSISSDATLTIDAGTVLGFTSGTEMTVEPGSKIIANGTSSQPIRFERLDPTQAWGQVYMNGSGNQFTWCLFDGGNKNVGILSKNNSFSNCTFRNGWRGISSGANNDGSGGNSSFTLNNCMIQ